jgi:drug/metabolite transporter (DMT)-like permease
MKKSGFYQIHLAVLLFSLAGLMGKMISLSPILIVLGRVAFASLALAGILYFLRVDFRLEKRDDAFFLPLLGCVLALHWIAFFQSIQVSTVAVGLLSYSAFPVFAALIEPLISGDRISVKEVSTASVAVLGAAVLVPSFAMTDNITRGVFWGVLSGALFALLSVLNRRYAGRYSGLIIAFYEDVAAAVVLAPIAFFAHFQLEARDFFLLAFLGIVSTAAAHSLFISGMKYVRARTASVIATLEPVYGIAFAILLLGEIPAFRTIAGGILILGAAAFAMRSEKAKVAGLVGVDQR